MAGEYLYLETDTALEEAGIAAKRGLDALGMAWVNPESGLPDPMPPNLEGAAVTFAAIQRLAEEARAAIAAEVAAEQERHDEDADKWDAQQHGGR